MTHPIPSDWISAYAYEFPCTPLFSAPGFPSHGLSGFFCSRLPGKGLLLPGHVLPIAHVPIPVRIPLPTLCFPPRWFPPRLSCDCLPCVAQVHTILVCPCIVHVLGTHLLSLPVWRRVAGLGRASNILASTAPPPASSRTSSFIVLVPSNTGWPRDVAAAVVRRANMVALRGTAGRPIPKRPGPTPQHLGGRLLARRVLALQRSGRLERLLPRHRS